MEDGCEGDAEPSRTHHRSLLTLLGPQALAAKFALYQSWPEKKDQLDPILKSIIQTDAESTLGKGAVEYRRLLEL